MGAAPLVIRRKPSVTVGGNAEPSPQMGGSPVKDRAESAELPKIGLLALERATSGRAPLSQTPPVSPAFAASQPPDRSAKGLAAAMSSPGASEPPLWREVFRFLRNPHKVSRRVIGTPGEWYHLTLSLQVVQRHIHFTRLS